MTVSLTTLTLNPNTGGVTSSSSLTVVANTRALYFFIALDNTNTASNNIAPSEVSWNGINATYVTNVVTDTATPYGQCLWLYKIDNPTPGTGNARVGHATQYHHQTVVSVISAQPVTINVSGNAVRGTGTSASISIPSSNGDTTVYCTVVDATDSLTIAPANGSTVLVSDGGTSRQGMRICKSTSSGLTNTETWTWASSNRYAALAINIAEGTYQVDSINGASTNPTINVSSVNTANTTGMGTITGLTISDGVRSISPSVSMPSGDGSFAFTWPYSDGVIAPLFGGTVTATFGDGVRTLSITGTYPLPVDYSSVTFTGASNLSPYHLGSVLTLLDGQKLYWPSGVIISSDGSINMNGVAVPCVLNCLLHNVQSGGDGSIVTVSISLAATGMVQITKKVRFRSGIGIGIGL